MGNNYFAIYYLYYKIKFRITKFAYNSFFIWLLFQLLSLSIILFSYIIKFIIYYLYYKNQIIGNLTQTFIYILQIISILVWAII